MRRYVIGLMVTSFLGGLVLPQGSPVSAQMPSGTRGEQGMMGRGQTFAMPMQQMSEVIAQMADRLASGKGLDRERAKRLRRLADQLILATARMSEGMGGMGGGGMMRQGSGQMAGASRILAQISDLVRGK